MEERVRDLGAVEIPEAIEAGWDFRRNGEIQGFSEKMVCASSAVHQESQNGTEPWAPSSRGFHKCCFPCQFGGVQGSSEPKLCTPEGSAQASIRSHLSNGLETTPSLSPSGCLSELLISTACENRDFQSQPPRWLCTCVLSHHPRRGPGRGLFCGGAEVQLRHSPQPPPTAGPPITHLLPPPHRGGGSAGCPGTGMLLGRSCGSDPPRPARLCGKHPSSGSGGARRAPRHPAPPALPRHSQLPPEPCTWP